MNVSDARRLMATYLAGGAVSAEQLRQAQALLGRDELRVHEELRAPAGRGDCSLFLANLAEFCEMSNERRRAEAPEARQHVRECSSCRKAYRDMRPSPVSAWVASLPKAGPRIARTLFEPIELAVSVAERAVEQLLGPPPVPLWAHARAMSSDAGADYKKWVLEDKEAGVTIELVVKSESDGRVALQVSVEGGSGARVKVVEQGRERDSMEGPLSVVLADPLYLTPGVETTVSIEIAGRLWEIPLYLAPAAAEADDD